jgi:hypothetical protein
MLVIAEDYLCNGVAWLFIAWSNEHVHDYGLYPCQIYDFETTVFV